ncbi:transporter substrate-binding domain-containing protein [Rhizobium pusense]|uniref:transporter substrate-binding domain-containing protein n=1 Tax=Agrobacterium pusense TaxID=648995 RepID=UPI001FCD6497|nr:transporter substrate-binding domain-containing protein [Agrobacterium pusense]MCJ2877466.1 transporter substrate-binding domain-containing protein [Agrobacterium pusense]
MTSSAFECSTQEKAQLASSGVLRVAVAVGPAASAVWCVRDETSGQARGVTITLAKEIAKRSGLELELIEYSSSGDIVSNSQMGKWTLSFVPVDDQRRAALGVGPNYYLGVSTYLARKEQLKTVEDVDRQGVRAAGVAGTATLRSAERSLKNISIEAIASLEEALARFRKADLDAIALGKESILSMLPGLDGCHAVEGHFHEAGTAIVVPKTNVHALSAVTRMMTEMKADGTVRAAFDQNHMGHADIAP